MNKKMIKIAHKLFKLIGEYIKEFEKTESSLGFIYIKHDNGEILCFADSIKTLKENTEILN